MGRVWEPSESEDYYQWSIQFNYFQHEWLWPLTKFLNEKSLQALGWSRKGYLSTDTEHSLEENSKSLRVILTPLCARENVENFEP